MHFFSYQIESILVETITKLQKNTTIDFAYKTSSNKWSKKEILGHLIDSALHNTRRFTEAQFSKDSYLVQQYNQDELVKINDYQNKNTNDLFELWIHLNKHIAFIIKDISEEKLNLKINLYDLTFCSLEALIEDYISHMKHHLKQVFNEA